MRKYVVPLFIANSIAFAAVGCSYVFYSRLLTAPEFGVYSAALAVGNLATLVLDGGIRTSIIKHGSAISRNEESALLGLMLLLSLVLIGAIFVCRSLIIRFYPAVAHDFTFVAVFAGIYLLSYPWIGLPTAQLERALAYGRLAWIESAGIALERAAPVVFLFLTHQGLYSFVSGLALGRLVRIAALAVFHRVRLLAFSTATVRSVVHLMREGAWYQAGAASSMLRDNLHVLVIGPMFGAAWVGYYAWGLQLCMIASQVFVQISARISIPITAQSPDFPSRWRTIAQQVALLTATTGPILGITLLLIPVVDHDLLGNKWQPALLLLPFLFARMLPGMACTPLGNLLLVERGARSFALASWVWTGIETIGVLCAVWRFGAIGLALSYSVAAWAGAALFIRGLRRDTPQLLAQTTRLILARPGLWLALCAVLPYLLYPAAGRALLLGIGLPLLAAAALSIVLLAYVADTDLRRVLFRGRSPAS